MLVLNTVMYVIAEKKLQLNIASLRCRNFYHWLCFNWGGGRAPWAPPLATPMLVIFVFLALLALLMSSVIGRNSCLRHAIGNYSELNY